MAGKDCAHAACSCSVGLEEHYCSAECARIAETPADDQEQCRCGHADCLGFAGAQGESGITGGAAKDWDAEPAPSGPRRAST